MAFVYLASPYSHPDAEVRADRYRAVQKVLVEQYLYKGICAYSPIVHWHNAALDHELATDAQAWIVQNENMLRRASAVHVLQIPGTEQSKGVNLELTWAHHYDLPVTYVRP